jgi:hypothetical protein
MIIGMSGFIGSGKGTVGDYLVSQHGWKSVSFAGTLKDAVSNIFCWPRHLLEGDTKEGREWREVEDTWWSNKLGKSITPRWVLQNIGTDVLRSHFDDRIWLLSVEKQIIDYTGNVVITDVRFKNEMKMVQSMPNAHSVWVIKGKLPDWYDIAEAANSETFTHAPECAKAMEEIGIHYSEWDWIGQPINYKIENNGTLGDLYQKVDDLLIRLNCNT